MRWNVTIDRRQLNNLHISLYIYICMSIVHASRYPTVISAQGLLLHPSSPLSRLSLIVMASASSCGPDRMIYKCMFCRDAIAPHELHLIHGPTRNKYLHIDCLPAYFRNFEEVNEREDREWHRAYWRNIRKYIRRFIKMKTKLKPKLHRFTKSRCVTKR